MTRHCLAPRRIAYNRVKLLTEAGTGRHTMDLMRRATPWALILASAIAIPWWFLVCGLGPIGPTDWLFVYLRSQPDLPPDRATDLAATISRGAIRSVADLAWYGTLPIVVLNVIWATWEAIRLLSSGHETEGKGEVAEL